MRAYFQPSDLIRVERGGSVSQTRCDRRHRTWSVPSLQVSDCGTTSHRIHSRYSRIITICRVRAEGSNCT